ncbi:hypothetical protein [Streptomyces sp. x-19]|uniref:hypothetical protein n=1 Tax=Streptomyces sp. x-19 TaxID=2789280 RepID=UPI00397EF1FA
MQRQSARTSPRRPGRRRGRLDGCGRLHAPAPNAPLHDTTEQDMSWLGAADWLPDPALHVDVAEAEFCGAAPAGGDRPAPSPAD